METVATAEKRPDAAVDGRRRPSLRRYLAILVLASLLPGVLGAGLMFLREYNAGRAALQTGTIATARALMQAVDSQLLRAQAASQALAGSDTLLRADLVRFHEQASSLIRQTGVGDIIVLSDESGQQLVNTLRRYGEPLPRHGNLPLLRQIFATGQPSISDIFVGGVTGKPLMTIEVPVIREGRVVYDLSIGLLPSHFNAILAAEKLPAGWIAGIFDSSGTLAGRIPSPEIYVGRKGTAEFIAQIRKRAEGSMATHSVEGVPTLSSWSRSEMTGWSVGIGIPREQLERDLKHSLMLLATGIAALVLAGLVLASLTARTMAKSIRVLSSRALAIGTGAQVELPRPSFREAGELARAICQAEDLLRARDAELQQYHRHLEQQVAERTAELLSANADLQRLAKTDPLTRVGNRQAANEHLRQEFLLCRRHGRSFAVMYIDIDYFKAVNDRWGHETGDQVLCSVAQLLSRGIRETDFIARYGGEEFVVVLADTRIDGAMAIAEKLRQTIDAQLFPVVQHITISVGVAVPHAEDGNEEVAVRRADKALYLAKNSGRNRVCCEGKDGPGTGSADDDP